MRLKTIHQISNREIPQLGSNALIGNGAAYMGSKNSFPTTNPYGQAVEMECDSWNKDVLRGN